MHNRSPFGETLASRGFPPTPQDLSLFDSMSASAFSTTMSSFRFSDAALVMRFSSESCRITPPSTNVSLAIASPFGAALASHL